MNDAIYNKMAIHRYLFETKFGGDEILPLSVSPYISDFINKNLDSLIGEFRKIDADENVKKWVDWRVLTKDRREFFLIKKELDNYIGNEKLEFLKIIASPFEIPEAYLKELLS